MVGALRDRGVGGLLQRHDAAAPPGAVAGDEHLGPGVLDAVAQGVDEKPPNTTECPSMRGDANSAIGSSGTMSR